MKKILLAIFIALFMATPVSASILSVPQGGTGVASVTSGNLIEGNGTAPFTSISPASLLGSYVPYTGATGAVNLNAQNLTNIGTFGLNGAQQFANTTGDIQADTQTVGSTTHTGSGTNNITISGTPTVYTPVTYTYTVTSLNGDAVTLNNPITGGSINVGDSVTFVHTSTTVNSTVLAVFTTGGRTAITIATPSSTLSTAFSFTDNTTGATASVRTVNISDLGTFTNGSTSLLYQPLTNTTGLRPIINGITITNSVNTGHTLGDSWSASIVETLGDILNMNTISGLFTTPLAADFTSATAPIFSSLSTGGVVEASTSGQLTIPNLTAGGIVQAASGTGMLSIATGSLMAIGNPVTSATDDGILYADASGNLANESGFTYLDQSGASAYNLSFTSSGNDWMAINDAAQSMTLGIQTGLTAAGLNTDSSGDLNIITSNNFIVGTASGNDIMAGSTVDFDFALGDVDGRASSAIILANGAFGNIEFKNVTTGNVGAKFDLSNTMYTIGDPSGASFQNQVIVDQSTGNTSITKLPQYASDALAEAGGLTSGMLYENTVAGVTQVDVVP